MHSKAKLKLIFFLIIVSFTVFACKLVGGDTGNGDAVLVPTDVVVQVTDEPEPTQAPTSTPAPTDVPPTEEISSSSAGIDVLQLNSFLDEFNTWNIVGLIQNNSNMMIAGVEIDIEIFDVSGNSLLIDTTYTDVITLAPGEVSSFTYFLYEELPDADNFVATVVDYYETDVERAYPEVLHTRLTVDEYGDYFVTGEILNTSDRPVLINSLAAALFTSGGEIETAGPYSVVVRYIEPGEVGPFRITLYSDVDPALTLSDFEIYLDAEFTDPILPSEIIISDASYYVDMYDYIHLVGTLTNAEDVQLNLTIVAGIYDVDGTVLDAADATVLFSAIEPGEVLPYDFDFWGPLNYSAELRDMADSYTIQIDSYWTWDATAEMFELPTQNVDNTFDIYTGDFTGQVVNDTGDVLSYTTVMVYLLDIATGDLVAVDYDFIYDEIPAGGVADFVVSIDIYEGFDVSTVEYYIVAKGER